MQEIQVQPEALSLQTALVAPSLSPLALMGEDAKDGKNHSGDVSAEKWLTWVV